MRVTVGNELELQCQVCGHTDFESRDVTMITGATVLGYDLGRQSAKCFVCSRCGFVHSFLVRRPEQ